MDAKPPHASCGVFPRGSWLAGLVAPAALEIPPADHPFWRGRGVPAHVLQVVSQLEDEKQGLARQLADCMDAKAATSSAVEWLQASNKKLTDKAAVFSAEAAQLRGQLAKSPQAVRDELVAQTREVQALRDEIGALREELSAQSARHEELLELQADTEEALLEAHTMLQSMEVGQQQPVSRGPTPLHASTPSRGPTPSRAPTPSGAEAALRGLHADLRAAREAAEDAEARATAVEAASHARAAAAEARAQAAEDRLAQHAAAAPSPQPPSPSAASSSESNAALAGARAIIRRLESQLDAANRMLARSKGAVAGVDGAVSAGTYAEAESNAVEARDLLSKALTKLDWSTSRIKALTAALEDERKQARARELKLANRIDIMSASGGTPSRGGEEASLRAQLREARAAASASRAREVALEQRVFALERQYAAQSEPSAAAAAELAELNLAEH